MEQHLPEPHAYIEKAKSLGQAMFYFYNSAGLKIPVCIIREFNFVSDDTLCFNISSFPLTENAWNIFAAELQMHKKALPYSIEFSGVASLQHQHERLFIEFKVRNVHVFEEDASSADGILPFLIKSSLQLYKKGSDFLQQTLSFKRKDSTSVAH